MSERPEPTNEAVAPGFRERVLAVVRAIPRGRVATYGQVALLAGSPRAARQVGGVLYRSGSETALPWHRVVNASGGISTHKVGVGALQEALLRAEGIAVGEGGVDLERHRWTPDARALSPGAPPARSPG